MQDINFPLIVAEGLDLSFFMSISDLENDIELHDVNNDVFITYDAKGFLYRLNNKNNKVVVEKVLDQNVSKQKIELIKLIREFLGNAKAVRGENIDEQLDLLIDNCRDFYYLRPSDPIISFLKRVLSWTKIKRPRGVS